MASEVLQEHCDSISWLVESNTVSGQLAHLPSSNEHAAGP